MSHTDQSHDLHSLVFPIGKNPSIYVYDTAAQNGAGSSHANVSNLEKLQNYFYYFIEFSFFFILGSWTIHQK